MKLKKLISSSQYSLYKILEVINSSGLGITFCVDNDEKFIGALSDGDLRRAILAGVPLNTLAHELLNRNSESFKKILEKCENPEMLGKLKQESVCAHYKTSTIELMNLVNERVTIIPLINDERKIVDYFEYKANFKIPIANSILSGQEISNVLECLETNWISSQGKFILQFEELFCQYTGAKYAVSVMNGTAALSLALSAVGIGLGDEVIVPDLTFAATINAVLQVGATPVIVDVNLSDWCISKSCIQNAITKKTKGIIPVHLYGYPCNMDEILEITQNSGIHIIEDNAEALGGKFKNKLLGTFGSVGCYSFFGNKVITTGEGGMCTTDDENIYQKLKVIRDHGMSKEKKYWHTSFGFNYRMTNLQAAIGCGQIQRIEEILEKRDRIQEFYFKNLDMKFFETQKKPPNGRSIVWLVSVLLSKKINKEKFISILGDEKIDIRPFFYPLSEMPIYKPYVHGEIKVSNQISSQGVNLPTLINLDEENYKYICNKINQTLHLIK